MPLDPTTRPVVAVLAYDGLCLFEFATAMEVLADHKIDLPQHWYRRIAVSLEGPRVRTDAGAIIEIEAGLEALSAAHTIIVPGWRMGPVPEQVSEALCQAHARGVRIASICTGAFVLAAAGLLDGRRAATHWRYAELLAGTCPAAVVDPSVLYVDEGDILSSAGSSAALDLLLHMIRQDYGPGVGNRVARAMVAPPHREGGQSQFIETTIPTRPPGRFAGVLEDLRRDPGGDHSIRDLARRAAMSPRTFFRRFRAVTGQTPYDWLMIERIRLAKILLEESDRTIGDIALQVGFATPDSFRHHFRRVAGVNPTQFRGVFRQAGEVMPV